ncbi:hypothetical protein ABZU45_41610 [Streptomyces avermitilis]|uniref:hypothetical protein n=1 Tax=Streptomyces avermitilis TaxID=33903 RepID=UPI0033A2BA64
MHSAPRTAPQQSLGRFGIFSHELRSEDPALQEQRRRAAAQLEELGFGVIWLGGNSSVHHAAALAGSTERIALATGILNISRAVPPAAQLHRELRTPRLHC